MEQEIPTALMQRFRSFHTAVRATEGIEAMHIMRKGQVKRSVGRNAAARVMFVESLFQVAA
jgi:transposase-like protein